MYSFGISREFYKNVYIPEAKQNRDVDIPGPGTYNDGLSVSKERNPQNNQQYHYSEYKNVKTTDFGKYS